jgi:phosphate/sulfate permease
MEIVIFSWIALSLLVGAYAGHVNKPPYIAIILSLITSPIIGLIITAWVKNECKNCHYESKTYNEFCPICGNDSKGHDIDWYIKSYKSEKSPN